MKSEKSKKLRVLTECAIMVALATVLSLLKIWEAPLGGAVTLFSMVPIILISYLHGCKWGLAAGLVHAVIQLILGFSNVMYVPSAIGVALCIGLDYIVPFTLIGLAGAFRNLTKNNILNVIIGSFTVCVIRYASHVIVGGAVWYELTKAGDWNEYVHTVGMWVYSFVYNIQFMGPETALTLIAAPALAVLVKLLSKKNA
jgi:thiamine transporter